MRLSILLLFALLCAQVQAQQIFRSVMPDGKIVFGDKPAPGAKESKPVVLRQSNVAQPGPTSGGAPSARQQALEGSTNELVNAQQNLERAKQALEIGRNPTPEEQQGTVKSGKGGTGGVRTSEAYEQRVKALEQEVTAAQRQLDEAQSRRNEAR